MVKIGSRRFGLSLVLASISGIMFAESAAAHGSQLPISPIPGEVICRGPKFDGRCVGPALGRDLAESHGDQFLAVSSCDDEDGNAIDGCMHLTVRKPDDTRVQMTLAEDSCRPTILAAFRPCYAGYEYVRRVDLESYIYADGTNAHVRDAQTWFDRGRRGWVRRMSTEVYFEQTGSWATSQGWHVQGGVVVRDGAGDVIDLHEMSFGGIAQSGSSDTTAADMCINLANQYADVHEMFAELMMDMADAIYNLFPEVTLNVGPFRIPVSVVSPVPLIRKMLSWTNSAMRWFMEYSCRLEPGRYSHAHEGEQSDPDDVSVDPPMEDPHGWIDYYGSGSYCFNSETHQTAVWEDPHNGVCSQAVKVECGTLSGGECGCVTWAVGPTTCVSVDENP